MAGKTRTSFSKERPGPGRTVGVPNKATTEIKELAAKLLNDPAYVEALKVRLRRGTAQVVEVQLYHYAYGKPKEDLTIRLEDVRKLPTDQLVERARQLAARLGTTAARRVLEDA